MRLLKAINSAMTMRFSILKNLLTKNWGENRWPFRTLHLWNALSIDYFVLIWTLLISPSLSFNNPTAGSSKIRTHPSLWFTWIRVDSSCNMCCLFVRRKSSKLFRSATRSTYYVLLFRTKFQYLDVNEF